MLFSMLGIGDGRFGRMETNLTACTLKDLHNSTVYPWLGGSTNMQRPRKTCPV